MACYHPIHAFYGKETNGKCQIVFKKSESWKGEPIDLPCGQCIGCRLEYSRQWAIRCMHESSLYDENCFITLTYKTECLPENGQLNLRHFQLFMKRLRKKFKDRKIRFYHCGEYGERFGRPHYHCLLFNLDFPDKVIFGESGENTLYTSQILDDLWENKGLCIIGSVSFESAGYVARYMMKKAKGNAKDPDRVSEYATMSRMPGIGNFYANKYLYDMYPRDKIFMNGQGMMPPKYYDSVLEKVDPEIYEKVKKRRKNNEVFVRAYHKGLDGRMVLCSESEDYRLGIKEKVKKAEIKIFGRRTIE